MQDKPSQDSCHKVPQEQIETVATVISVERGWARLTAERRSACASCSAAKGCGTASLAGLFSDRPADIFIRDDFEARPGEQVVIAMSGGRLVLASLLIYLVPLLGLIAGAIGGSMLALGDLGAALLAVLGLVGGFLLARRFGTGGAAAAAYAPVFVRRLSEGGLAPSPSFKDM